MGPRSYSHVVRAVMAQPWAIRPEVLPVVAEVVATHIAGGRPSDQEIAERIGSGPATRPVRSVGSVAILPLYGVLFPKASMLGAMSGGTSLSSFRASLREAVASPQVSAIVLDVDSPGGTVGLVPETADEVRAARGSKPIVAVANTDAFSAAYWIATQADELVVTPSGAVGSVGVLAIHEELSKALDMAGIKTTIIRAGKYKAEANDIEPLTDEARAAIQAHVDEYYRMFTAAVARGRGVPVETVRTDYGQGRTLTAQQALSAGMVDRIDTFEGVLKRLGVRQAAVRAQDALLEVTAGELAPPVPTLIVPGPARPLAAPIAPHDTDVVDVPWDGGAAEAAIPNDAGEDVFKRMYAWQDPDGDPNTKAAYKLPHHEVSDGRPGPANVNGVRAALSRLPQSDVPDADQAGTERHLKAHLDRFNEQRDRRARARERTLALHRAGPS